MNGFMATSGDSEDGPDTDILLNNGFFPDVDCYHARQVMRLDGNASPARTREQLLQAMISVNAELSCWRLVQISKGFDRLIDVSAAALGGENQLAALYRRAVYSCAAAVIVEQYRGHDASVDSVKKAEDQRPLIDEYRRDKREAIAAIQGRSRAVVELI